MTRQHKDLGARRHVRIDFHKRGFVIPSPGALWIECQVLDISEKGVRLDVGSRVVPDVFGLSLTAGGEVLRVCSLVWRRGHRLGARFLTAKELREGPNEYHRGEWHNQKQRRRQLVLE
jgi:hypothetical protein